MLNNEPGPRDWAPSAAGSGPSIGLAPRARNAAISLITGSLAVALGLMPLFGGHPTLILSTVGITAILAGVAGLTRWSWAGVGIRVMSVIGVALGVIGILLTITSVLHIGLVGAAAPIQVPDGRYAAATGSPSAVPTPTQTRPAVGLPPTDAQVAQYTGTVVVLLRHSHDMTGTYPGSLPTAPGALITTAAGSLRLPPGIRLSYTVRDDRSGYDMLGSTDDDSVVIEYDTASGMMQWVHR